MFIKEIMTRDVVTVDMDDTLVLIREVFDLKPFHHVLVTEMGRLVGVISDRDLLKNISPFVGKFSERTQDLASLRKKAHQIMSRAPVTVLETTPIPEASAKMLKSGISCLPVVDEKGFVRGIVTWRDMLKWCYEAGCRLPGDFKAA